MQCVLDTEYVGVVDFKLEETDLDFLWRKGYLTAAYWLEKRTDKAKDKRRKAMTALGKKLKAAAAAASFSSTLVAGGEAPAAAAAAGGVDVSAAGALAAGAPAAASYRMLMPTVEEEETPPPLSTDTSSSTITASSTVAASTTASSTASASAASTTTTSATIAVSTTSCCSPILSAKVERVLTNRFLSDAEKLLIIGKLHGSRSNTSSDGRGASWGDGGGGQASKPEIGSAFRQQECAGTLAWARAARESARETMAVDREEWEQRQTFNGDENELSAKEEEEKEAEEEEEEGRHQRVRLPSGAVSGSSSEVGVPSVTDTIGIYIDALPLSNASARGSSAGGALREPELRHEQEDDAPRRTSPAVARALWTVSSDGRWRKQYSM